MLYFLVSFIFLGVYWYLALILDLSNPKPFMTDFNIRCAKPLNHNIRNNVMSEKNVYFVNVVRDLFLSL